MNHPPKPSDTLPAQRYLDAASNLLLSTSPHISAFLASQRQRLNPPATLSLPSNCRACGHHLIPGWSCSVAQRRPARATKASTAKAKAKITKKPVVAIPTFIDYECSLCNSVNTFRSSTQPPRRQSKAPKSSVESKQSTAPTVKPTLAPIVQSSSAPTSAPSPATSSGAASTTSDQPRGDKKKNRKQKLGGLQAMLAKSKATPTPSQGFDFMDFMKTT